MCFIRVLKPLTIFCGTLVDTIQVKKLVHDGQEVVIVGGSHSLHEHEKLAIAVSKAIRGHSLQETKNDGRFHVRTKTYLDGALLKEVVAPSLLF